MTIRKWKFSYCSTPTFTTSTPKQPQLIFVRVCAELRTQLFAKKHASAFTLLAAYAATERFPDYEVPDEVLADLRARVLTYVETLEGYAARSHSSSVQHLLTTNAELKSARHQCFVSLCPLSVSQISRRSYIHTAPREASTTTQNSLQLGLQQASTASDTAGDAAEERARASAQRGIGDSDQLEQQAQETRRQVTKGTQDHFGATRAAALRSEKQKRMHAGANSPAPTSTQPPLDDEPLSEHAQQPATKNRNKLKTL